jgi:hypothetical protein
MLKLFFSHDFDPIMCDDNGNIEDCNEVTKPPPPSKHCKNRGP